MKIQLSKQQYKFISKVLYYDNLYTKTNKEVWTSGWNNRLKVIYDQGWYSTNLLREQNPHPSVGNNGVTINEFTDQQVLNEVAENYKKRFNL